MTSGGDMIAGGYTMDETIFVDPLRDGIDAKQNAVPVLALYPLSDVTHYRLFQIFFWPNEIPIGISG